MRIIGGRARGRRLASPRGETVRPTGDRVREALFNIWGQNLEGVRLLDVCAGSGAISLEALSRGAAEAVALEVDPGLCRRLEEEAGRLGLSAGLKVVRGDARRELARLRQSGAPPFDLAFVDPPWRETALRRELADLLFEPSALCREAAVEVPRGEEFMAPAGAELIRQSRYGDTRLCFLRVREGRGA
ncbi:MAG: 16S rRNA (guanine(966)-N(2))-methyltransferase RsmD [Candidatus Tectomicrobia bacterium]|uniref:16S rRNA (Guanine(966)-N(2))-methyltransferase RsmD n=1 Tax=Tectimicrobiota bacterium TaxID=2528274 RepID=A0A932MR70_UNCTE|nr:16S rRNA (guanine(966)-N(2))-methyltransferase RsmD [Candidatus Tectomicrobia bacterium]